MNNISKKDTFKETMDQARSHMSPSGRLFSSLIHIKPVEIISGILAKTLFRPVAIISGGVAAIAIGFFTWMIAKYYGYQLSGSEIPAGFLVGWIFGLLYDYASLIFTTGNKRT